MGTFGAGTYAHILVSELNKQFGLQMRAVHYKGEAPMWQDFAAGVLHAATGSYPQALNAVQSGAGRAIAVSMTKRNKRLPDVPTFIEQGVHSKVFALVPYYGFAGPAGMPQHVVERLSALMVEAGKSDGCRSCSKRMASTSPRKITSLSRNCTTTRYPFGSRPSEHWG